MSEDRGSSMTRKASCFPEVPAVLLAKARVLAGETAWRANDAVDVIDHLASKGVAVVGVELWREDEGAPRWIASSDYELKAGTSASDYVTQSKNAAVAFVQRFSERPDALFNLTWETDPATGSDQDQ